MANYGIPNYLPTDPRIQKGFPLSWEDIQAALSMHDRPLPQEMGPAMTGGLTKEQIVQQSKPNAFEILMAQLGNPLAQSKISRKERKQAMRSSPYTAAIQEIRRQIAQTGAQSQQNVADIQSWFGQYAGQMRGSAKENKQAGKAALRSNRQDLAGVLESGMVGDPTIRGQMAGATADEARYLRDSNVATSQFDQRMIADASRQQAYQALVQSRLGAQAQADLRAKIPGLAQERASSVSESLSQDQDDRFSKWAQIMNMLPQEQRAELLGFPSTGEDEDPFKWRNQLSDAMSGIEPVFKAKDESGNETTRSSFGNFNELLEAYQSAVTGAGLNINDPQVRDAYRRYIAAYVLGNVWNPYAQSAGLKPMRLDPVTQSRFIPK